MTPDVSAAADAFGLAVGDASVQTVRYAVRRSGRCSVVLSDGSTPRTPRTECRRGGFEIGFRGRTCMCSGSMNAMSWQTIQPGLP